MHIDLTFPPGPDAETKAKKRQRHHDEVLKRARAATFINSYMLRLFYFDPRLYGNFLDDVLEPEERTLRQMREIAQLSPSRYELWRVRGTTFSRDNLRDAMMAHADKFDGIVVHLCVIKDNDFDNIRFTIHDDDEDDKEEHE